MKSIVLWVFVLAQPVAAFTQSQKPTDVKLLQGFQFAFKLSNGFNTTQSVRMDGNSGLSGSLVHQHAFNLEGIQYLGNTGVFVDINLGLGINGFAFKTSTDQEFLNSSFYRYYDKLEAFPYWHADVGAGYAHQFNDKWILRSQFKIGVRTNGEIASVSTFSDIQGSALRYELLSQHTSHSILRLESDLGYKLKNNDILELGVFYTYATSPVYTGTYTYFSDGSTGSFQNYGRELGLTLNYVLTGYARRLAINPNHASGTTRSENKTQFRSERRMYQVSSWLIGPQIGLHAARFHTQANSTVGSGSFPDAHFGINVNYNPTRNTFWEGDFSYRNYDAVTITKYISSASWSSGDFILSLSAGKGYRLIGRNNYNWLNISAGAGLNFIGAEKGNHSSSTTTTFSNNGEVLLDVRGTTEVLHRFYPSLYLNLSKDFLLGANSFISLAFRHTEGFYPVVQQAIQTSGSDVTGGTEHFHSNFSGGSNTFSIGYKRRFNPTKK